MIPNDMKTEEQPPQLVADQDALIDEIIDLKRKLNTMVRLCKSIYINEGAGKASPDDLDIWDDLEKQGYGGDEVPE
jgi:hypothetical protein